MKEYLNLHLQTYCQIVTSKQKKKLKSECNTAWLTILSILNKGKVKIIPKINIHYIYTSSLFLFLIYHFQAPNQNDNHFQQHTA